MFNLGMIAMNKRYFLEKVCLKQANALTVYDYSLVPETFLATDKLKIVCRTHGEFQQKAAAHQFGSGCPACGLDKNVKQRTLTTVEFIAVSQKRFGDRFDYSKTDYVKKDVQLILTCKVHGDIILTPEQHRWLTTGCPKCDYEEPRKEKLLTVLTNARKIHGDKYDYSKVVYKNTTERVNIVCPFHGDFWQSLDGHVNKKTECPQCVISNSKVTFNEFLERARLVHGEAYSYDKVVFETMQSPIIITCLLHGDFWQRAGSHLAGSKCIKCFRDESKLGVTSFIENARLVHGDKFNYERVKYFGNKVPVEIICPLHGSFWKTPNEHTSSKSGCKRCKSSKGETAVEIVLIKYGIEFQREYKIEPYNYRYDFYLHGLNIFIEFHGHQHYFPVERFGGIEEHEKVKERDRAKVKLVSTIGGKLIVLHYFTLTDNSVEKVLIQRLKKIYAYWFIIDGKLRAFRTMADVSKVLDLPPAAKACDVVNLVLAKYNAKVLF